jgi:hypothetical protein
VARFKDFVFVRWPCESLRQQRTLACGRHRPFAKRPPCERAGSWRWRRARRHNRALSANASVAGAAKARLAIINSGADLLPRSRQAGGKRSRGEPAAVLLPHFTASEHHVREVGAIQRSVRKRAPKEFACGSRPTSGSSRRGASAATHFHGATRCVALPWHRHRPRAAEPQRVRPIARVVHNHEASLAIRASNSSAENRGHRETHVPPRSAAG